MRKDSAAKLTGNNQFEGYAIDLIREITMILGFNFTFRLVPDGRYGSLNKQTGEWDGMVRELLEQRADLAIGDLTITYEREQVVDFTMPVRSVSCSRFRRKTKSISLFNSTNRFFFLFQFMNLGISVLYRKPVKQPPNLFSFLSPLSLGNI